MPFPHLWQTRPLSNRPVLRLSSDLGSYSIGSMPRIFPVHWPHLAEGGRRPLLRSSFPRREDRKPRGGGSSIANPDVKNLTISYERLLDLDQLAETIVQSGAYILLATHLARPPRCSNSAELPVRYVRGRARTVPVRPSFRPSRTGCSTQLLLKTTTAISSRPINIIACLPLCAMRYRPIWRRRRTSESRRVQLL